MYNEANFKHKCLSCTHNFATCSNSHPLFLSDAREHATKLPRETDFLPGDLILWCDIHEEVDLDKEKVILEKIDNNWYLTQNKFDIQLSQDEAQHFIERHNLREVFPGTYILPSKE